LKSCDFSFGENPN